MYYHVSSDSCVPHEGLPTFLTFVGFLSCVNPFMCLKGCTNMECFPTFLTFIVFLYSVISLMFFGPLAITEGPPTYLTFIWLLPMFLIVVTFVSSVTFEVHIKE